MSVCLISKEFYVNNFPQKNPNPYIVEEYDIVEGLILDAVGYDRVSMDVTLPNEKPIEAKSWILMGPGLKDLEK